MTTQLTPGSSRHLALDGLRGIAALGVAITHAYPTHTFWALWSLVDLFFVLSGFLIGSIVLDSRVNVPNFLVRRALRIWPVYYITLAVAVAASYLRVVGNPDVEGPDGVLSSLFFVQFVDLYSSTQAEAAAQVRGYILWFGHSWTLAVEQQFYVVLPILVVLFRPSARTVILAACVALAGTVMMRGSGQCLGLLASRADGLVLGVVLAALLSARHGAPASFRHPPRLLWPLLALTGAALVAPYVVDGYLGRIPAGTWPTNPFIVLGYAVLYFALVGWVVTEPESALSKVFGSRVLVYLGTISYAVYMFHPLIQGFVGMYDRTLPITELPIAVQIAMWLLLLGCSHLSKVLVEDRFNALKARFPLYRGTAVPVGSSLANS